jgi:outer membrane protein assembly factor BamB
MRAPALLLCCLAACPRNEPPAVDAAPIDAAPPVDAPPPRPDSGGPLDVTWDPDRHPWPMFGHDPRRTGRSEHVGPVTYTPGSTSNWVYTATGGAVINMQPAVTDQGVYFGTWGVVRGDASAPRDQWTKFDGRYYGLALDAPARDLFAPFDPGPNPYCYTFPARPTIPRDWAGCGGDNGLTLSLENGTIEGTALVDPIDGRHYIGRGDGSLYAIDPSTGTVAWELQTFNPELPEDPDGGGEIVGGAVMDPRGRIYFATFGAPPEPTPDDPLYETHAIYAVDREGRLIWRYPELAARISNPIAASPALSPDGNTLYVATWLGPDAGTLLAFDLSPPDEAELKWLLTLENPARPASRMWVRHISVGVDGMIYLAGMEEGAGYIPIVAAIRDEAAQGTWAWSPAVAEPQGFPTSAAQWVQGLALWEEAGATIRIYASTSHARIVNGTGGLLFVLDAATGAEVGRLDPATLPVSGVGGMTAPTLDAAEHVYVGIRGQHDLLAPPELPMSLWRDGAMYGLAGGPGDPTLLWHMVIDGQLDWAHPAIGANGALYFGSSDSYAPGGEGTRFDPGEPAEPNRDPRFHAVID